MKKVTFLIVSFAYSFSFSQQQVGNGDMELWDNVGQSSEEPSNWNSFKTGQGSFASFASQQVQRSTAIRTGATGQYCVRVWSKSTLGIVANGNLTLGKINMGSSTPSDPANYNFSQTADANFSEALTTTPDSIVFWVKYTSANASDSARVHAIIHDSYDLRDPIDANSLPHVVASAELNYSRTSGSWVRKSVPFVYVPGSPAPTPAFILLTFTTNKTPGGGSANDEVLVDDIELIYNSTIGVETIDNQKEISAYYSTETGLVLNGGSNFLSIITMEGKVTCQGSIDQLNGTKLNTGIYFIQSANSAIKILVP
jgi:hypothetical protein